MERDGAQKKFLNAAQAQRTAWRIIRDWVLAQLALVDAHQMEISEAFFQHAISERGTTLYEEFTKGNFKLIGSGN